ncbi:MAG TPA: metallophosphoesterase [Planktothrix sp.]|jgi:DNA repair exonuclease SbcCD nuclease subunit
MASEVSRFTFLQLSDVHLDSRQLALSAPLSQAQRLKREQEVLQTFLRSLDVARDHKVDVVLIPGDLWENETVTGNTITTVIQACASLGNIPILIAPGNRDYYSSESPYNAKTLKLRGLPAWSDNVVSFSQEKFVTIRHPHRQEVTFTGRAFTSPKVESERLLKDPIAKVDGLNLLVFHGALEGYAGADADWENKQTAPFSAQELRAQNFAYAALGHYHEICEVRTETGVLLGAYSGCPSGRNFDEPGPHCVLLGTIESNKNGAYDVQLEPIEVDSRRLLTVSADITGLSSQDMMDEITLAIEDQGGRPKTDIVLVNLDGTFAASVNPEQVLQQLRSRYCDLVVVDNSRPDYLSEKFDTRTTEAKYIDALLALKRDIEQKRVTTPGITNALTGAIVEDALYYGLDALRQKRITIRDVD